MLEVEKRGSQRRGKFKEREDGPQDQILQSNSVR